MGFIKTELGFRDISLELARGDFEFDICKYDVLRGILIKSEKQENHGGKIEPVYYFLEEDYGLRGRIFPLDEIVRVGQEYDIIIQKCKDERREIRGVWFQLNADAHIYHDFKKGERFSVRVSDRRKDPSFEVFNHARGFIIPNKNPKLHEKINIGSIVLVEVAFCPRSNGKILPLVNPLEILR